MVSPRAGVVTKVSGLWRGLAMAVGAFLVLYAAWYAPIGPDAASPVFDVIRAWGGIRLHGIVGALLGAALLVSMWTRASFLVVVGVVLYCGFSVVALFIGYRIAGYGWLGWLAFALVGFLATLLAWFAPENVWNPIPRRWRHPAS